MALTQEQLDQIAFQDAQSKSNRKMELVQVAKDILLEADRSKPVDERGVSASDITAYAVQLMAYVSQ